MKCIHDDIVLRLIFKKMNEAALRISVLATGRAKHVHRQTKSMALFICDLGAFECVFHNAIKFIFPFGRIWHLMIAHRLSEGQRA
jgi:hypothetical protein